MPCPITPPRHCGAPVRVRTRHRNLGARTVRRPKAAARRVTFTDSTKYADGRRDLRLSFPEHFREAVAAYNAVVFDNGVSGHKAHHGDVFDLRPDDDADAPPDLVYLEPPYAPPTDDADYIKRYHLLEGLSDSRRSQ